MKKYIWPVNLLLLAAAWAAAFGLDMKQPLPNWLDPARERADGKPAVRYSSAATPAGFRLPAEYEPVSAVVIGWAGYTDMLTAIARGASGQAGAEVWAAEGPAAIPGVPAARYSQINAPIDTVWARDYGPFGISAGQTTGVGIVDAVYRHYQYRRNDDALPSNLGKIKKIGVFGTNLILDGGNVMVDSKANLFMTRRTYIWNSGLAPEQVDAEIRAAFKVKNIYAFEYAGYPGAPADGTGHIDMFMKLLNDHTVLISTADSEPFKSNAEKAIAFFKDRTAPDGAPYKVIAVRGWYSGAWYTYTNSLIVNNTALIPSYSGHTQENAQAKAAYEAGMPGAAVVAIPSDSSISAGGSVHCLTQTIPAFTGRNRPGTDISSTGGSSATVLQKFEDMDITPPPDSVGDAESAALGQLKNSGK